MDRREALKKLALGGVTIVGGTGLIVGTAGAQKGGKGGGKPGTDPTPTPEPTPTPAPGDPIGVPLTGGSPAFVEFLTYKGGKGAKARLRVAPGGGDFHGWQTLAGGGTNDNMSYEQMSLDYVDRAVPVVGDATYPAYLDVKAAFPTRDKTGSFSFYYWHGPAVPVTDGIYTGATYYAVTCHLVDGAFASVPFTATELVAPPTSAQL